MSSNVYLVFSKKPDEISAEEYDRWYHAHVRENIVSTGFTSARRYAITPATGTPGPYEHLALYEYEGDMSIWRQDLTRRIEQGEVVLPPWFKGITFGSWECVPIDEKALPER